MDLKNRFSDEELMEMNLPDVEFSERTRRKIMKTSQTGKYSGLPVRLATGNFVTDEEYKKEIEEGRNLKLL